MKTQVAIVMAILVAEWTACAGESGKSEAVKVDALTVHSGVGEPFFSVGTDLRHNVRVYGDKECNLKSFPAELAGATYIKTVSDMSVVAEGEVMAFKVGSDANVFVAVDDRATRKAKWMKDGWIDTGKDAIVDEEGKDLILYNLYRWKRTPGHKAGSTVKLGTNPEGAILGYFVVVTPGVEEPTGWDTVPSILARIEPPTFPDRVFDITQYGAVGDGKTMNTGAFKKAITACSMAGGGRVVVPDGTFLTGAIHFMDNVNLEVNGMILFSRNPDDYLPVVFTNWEGMDCYNLSDFLYAVDKSNIAITGKGTIEGQCDDDHWWDWKAKANKTQKQLRKMVEDRVPLDQRVFGKEDYLRPSLFHIVNCRNVLIENVTVKNSPFWTIVLTMSENITVDGITVISHYANNDGCNPNSSRYVHIKNCTFNTGDDGPAMKAGRNRDGRKMGPTEYVVIQNCSFTADGKYRYPGNCLLAVGSEMAGGIREMYMEDCRVFGPVNTGVINVKSNSGRGGFLMDIYARNIDTSGQTPRVKRGLGKARFFQRSPNHFHQKSYETDRWPVVVDNLDIQK